jgi:hypothetical protein
MVAVPASTATCRGVAESPHSITTTRGNVGSL